MTFFLFLYMNCHLQKCFLQLLHIVFVPQHVWHHQDELFKVHIAIVLHIYFRHDGVTLGKCANILIIIFKWLRVESEKAK